MGLISLTDPRLSALNSPVAAGQCCSAAARFPFRGTRPLATRRQHHQHVHKGAQPFYALEAIHLPSVGTCESTSGK